MDNSQRESLVKTQNARDAIDALLAGKSVPVAHTALIAPDGKVIYQHTGEVSILELRRVILANLPDPDYIGHRAYWAASLGK